MSWAAADNPRVSRPELFAAGRANFFDPYDVVKRLDFLSSTPRFHMDLYRAAEVFSKAISAAVSAMRIHHDVEAQAVFETFCRNNGAAPVLPGFGLEDSAAEVKKRFALALTADEGAALHAKVFESLGLATEFQKAQSDTLLRQGVLATWTAVEVMTEDGVRAFLNHRPAIALRFIDMCKSLDKLKGQGMKWPDLEAMDFNVSGSMGTLVVENWGVGRRLFNLKDFFSAAFPNDLALRNAADDNDLRLLYFRRNLLAHKAGIVDKQYVKESGDHLPVDTELPIEPRFLERAVIAASELARHFFRAASHELSPMTWNTPRDPEGSS